MADPTGINLKDLTNNPAITLQHNFEESAGNFDDWEYTVDIDAFSGDPNQVITIEGDWHLARDETLDGWAGTDWSGQYVQAPIPNPSGATPFFGTIQLDFDTGHFTWTFTYQQLLDNAAQKFDVYFVGKYGDQKSDSDLLKLTITCFLPGTMIATPAGETAVEALSIGDMILTADGRAVAVKWVGRKTMKASVFLHETMLPVRIAAGALGNGLPRQDLYLSANHAMVMGDMLVNAGAMVNGDTIRFVPLGEMPATFTYCHVETEAHDEILANGAPAETFVDYVTRKGFDNYAEYVALYGCDRIIPEMKRLRVSSRRQLPQALREQLGVAGFADGVEADLQKLLAVA